jgi:hypothetical protein
MMMGDGMDAGFGGSPYIDAGSPMDATWMKTDGGFVVPDGGVIPADRFITKVVSLDIGPCGGFEGRPMPGVIEGPPIANIEAPYAGGTDVLSLGNGGQIVVSFDPSSIVDGEGVDFIVFENPFDFQSGTRAVADPEPAQVSVSEDGRNWTAFPCDSKASPYTGCAGVHPVFSSPTNGISPIDPQTAGGDAYDLRTIGVSKAKYIRIIDENIEPCADAGSAYKTNGFDLDAIAIVNAALP